jgi:hypothetical protein
LGHEVALRSGGVAPLRVPVAPQRSEVVPLLARAATLRPGDR